LPFESFAVTATVNIEPAEIFEGAELKTSCVAAPGRTVTVLEDPAVAPEIDALNVVLPRVTPVKVAV
jgi:hypothetical protein